MRYRAFITITLAGSTLAGSPFPRGTREEFWSEYRRLAPSPSDELPFDKYIARQENIVRTKLLIRLQELLQIDIGSVKVILRDIRYKSLGIDLTIITSSLSALGLAPDDLRGLLLQYIPDALEASFDSPPPFQVNVTGREESREEPHQESGPQSAGSRMNWIWAISNASLVVPALLLAVAGFLMFQATHQENTILLRSAMDERLKFSDSLISERERLTKAALDERRGIASEHRALIEDLEGRLKGSLERGLAEAKRSDKLDRDNPVGSQRSESTIDVSPPGRRVTLLAINDVYRIEGVERGRRGGLARVRSLRRELEMADQDLITLHAGDAIFPSLLSKTFNGEQMVDTLNTLDGHPFAFDHHFFLTFGNHEFDKRAYDQAGILAARIRESQFYWLGTNITFAKDQAGAPLVRGRNLIRSKILEANGVKVGLFGLTINTDGVGYVEKFANALETARRSSAELRDQGAEIVVGLTHLTLEEDIAILNKLGSSGPDLIVGGHEHTRQSYLTDTGRRVLKADADAVSALVIKIKVRPSDVPSIEYEYRELADDTPIPDPDVDRMVQRWHAYHTALLCANNPKRLTSEAANLALIDRKAILDESTNCLDEEIGRTAVNLVAEEERIRSCETNFGNWIADQARIAFPGADAAFINAGSLRLNQNLPAGAILRRDLDELIQYDTNLFVVTIKRGTFEQVISNAVSGWPGNGRWLQISGFTFRHGPKGTTGDLTLLDQDGRRFEIGPDDEVRVVTTDYLLDPNGDRDGYTMLPKPDPVPPQSLRRVLEDALRRTSGAGIRPSVEGRIIQSTDLCRG